jgi:hypothetical protein
MTLQGLSVFTSEEHPFRWLLIFMSCIEAHDVGIERNTVGGSIQGKE